MLHHRKWNCYLYRCDYVFPEKRVFLQYTTTSPKLHKVLGVETPNFDED